MFVVLFVLLYVNVCLCAPGLHATAASRADQRRPGTMKMGFAFHVGQRFTQGLFRRPQVRAGSEPSVSFSL